MAKSNNTLVVINGNIICNVVVLSHVERQQVRWVVDMLSGEKRVCEGPDGARFSYLVRIMHHSCN